MTKYDELDAANKRMWDAFKGYEEECRSFILQLHRALIDYLKCSEKDVEWMVFTGGEDERMLKLKGIVELSKDKRMILYTNGFYRFVLRVHFGHRLVDLPFKVKKAGSYFTIQLGEDEAFPPDETRMETLAEYVYNTTVRHFETQFKNFVRGREAEPKSELGFSLPHHSWEGEPPQL